MPVPRDLLTEAYDYHLPPGRIATEPADPADHARLLVYNRQRDTITHTRFHELLNHLPEGLPVSFVIEGLLYKLQQKVGGIGLAFPIQ